MILRTDLLGSHLRVGNWGKMISLTLLLCLAFTLPSSAQTREKLLRTLTVNGRGVERIATTLSQISLGVEIQGKTAQEVQQEAARRSSAVIGVLKSRNVERLETTGVRLNPVYSYSNNVQKIQGYSATNTVSFRVPTDKAGAILDEAVKVGATRIDSVSFVAGDEAIAQAQSQALTKATQDAQRQANAVFSALGLQSKEIVSIQVNGASPPPPVQVAELRLANAASKDSVTPLVGGEQEVQASVTLQISY